MPSSAKQIFTYTTLKQPVVEELKCAVDDIRRFTRSGTEPMLAIGMALLKAKRHLDHGQFKGWVTQKCGFSVRTAERYMRVAYALEQKYDTVSHLQPSTIYRLSAKSLPQPVLASVLAGLATDPLLSDIGVNELIEKELAAGSQPARATTVVETRSAGLLGAWDMASEEERDQFLSTTRDVLLGTRLGTSTGREATRFYSPKSDRTHHHHRRSVFR